MIEEWKEIEGFSRYKVSNTGKVWDMKNDKEVAQVLAGKPQYYYVNVYNDLGKRKLKRVHRFVAEVFVEGRSEQFDVVDHIDRDKFNNHYTNLRWTDRRGNGRNRDGNIYIFGEAVKDYSLRYENPVAAYTYLSKCLLQCMTDQEAVDKYQEHLNYGMKRVLIEWEGIEVYLLDLCQQYNKDYFEVNGRLNKGWDIWNAIYNITPNQPYSIEIPCGLVTGHWFPSKTYLTDYFGKSGDGFLGLLESNCTYEELLNYNYLDNVRQTVAGFTGTIVELCKHFGVEQSMVETRRTRYGMTLEEALTQPKRRVKAVYLNGSRMSTKAMYEHFDIDAKRANGIKSQRGLTIHETLDYFGIDTSAIDLKY